MIEDVYFSHWSHKRILSADYDLDYAELTVRLARKHFKRLHLVTDSHGAEKYGHLDFDSISVSFDALPDYLQIFWSLGKLHACKLACDEGKPFLHLDFDVFLFKPLPEKLLTQGIITQSDEPLLYYGYPLNEFFQTFPNIPVEMKNKNLMQAFNCGIMGGNDLQFWSYYVDCVLDLAHNPANAQWWKDAKSHFDWYMRLPKNEQKWVDFRPEVSSAASICEQFMIACCAAHLNRRVSILFPDTQWPLNIHKHASIPSLGYVHLCSIKPNKDVHDRIKKRLVENDLIWPPVSNK